MASKRTPLLSPAPLEPDIWTQSTLIRLLNSRWFCEGIGFLFLGIALFLFVALLTASPQDAHWTQSGSILVLNRCGRAGAIIADLALNLFGEAAIFLPFLCGLHGVSWILRLPLWRRMVMMVPSLPLMLGISALFSLVLPIGLFAHYPVAGGMIGQFLRLYLVHNLNVMGTSIVLLTGSLVCFMGMTGMSLVGAYGYAGEAWARRRDQEPSAPQEPVKPTFVLAREQPLVTWQEETVSPRAISRPLPPIAEEEEEEEDEAEVEDPQRTARGVSLFEEIQQRWRPATPVAAPTFEPPPPPSWGHEGDAPKVMLRTAPIPSEPVAPPPPPPPAPRYQPPVAFLEKEEVQTDRLGKAAVHEDEPEDVYEEEPLTPAPLPVTDPGRGEEPGSPLAYASSAIPAPIELPPLPAPPSRKAPEIDEVEEEDNDDEGHYESSSLEAGTADALDLFQKLLAQGTYILPPLNLLDQPPPHIAQETEDYYIKQSSLLLGKMREFKVEGRITQVIPGPVITRYECEPAPGVKISKIANLSEDLALALRSPVPPRVASIPRKSVIGIEVPNRLRETIYFREILDSGTYQQNQGKIKLALGKDTEGTPFITDLTEMPHLLIAGTTGSGKSVCINTIMMSILMQAPPTEVQLILVDPKMLELSIYNDIPHLREPVVTDPKRAATALAWAVDQMERRYAKLAGEGVRNIAQYNAALRERAKKERWTTCDFNENVMPYLVIIIDELADLMVTCAAEVETCLQRLAQMARASGIHLILATQRPSVDVLTGTIKNNFPCRIAFRVASKVDSRTVIDGMGAEQLLGKGDMLFIPPGTSTLLRLHGAYISEREINKTVDFLKEQRVPELMKRATLQAAFTSEGNGASGAQGLDGTVDDDDEFLERAVELVLSTGYASISTLQRRFRVGYARAARLVDIMERKGIVGPFAGSGKGREVLVDLSYLEELKKRKKK